MKTSRTGRPEGAAGARIAATLSALAISLGVSTTAVAEAESSGNEPSQTSRQHKVESVQGKHLTSGQIKGESSTCAQSKIESVQGKHRASNQIKGETCAQIKIESQQHKLETPVAQPRP
jgi:hypothetical protein